ncbi:GAF domain-containing protein [Aliifodinibius salicampi]|uniref:histidine kinase n=1 Tax=Fodinibius salicampi TaxID=1920655 RepID=A0ABT3Q008_9BACT|nr:histidine kinase dimerization/phosphoacceptor domain -containing protein [Fodinibius salicampi]MCW9713467.1 GAF domain-containing protein [Fodinibius salicampi]
MFKLDEQGEIVTLPDLKSADRMQFLQKSMDKIGRSESLSAIINEGIRASKLILDADVGNLLLINPQTGELIETTYTDGYSINEGWPYPTQRAIAEWVLENKRTYYTNNLYGSLELNGSNNVSDSFHNIAALPLLIGDRSVGVLLLANNRESGPFIDEAINSLEILARFLAQGIDSKREYENLYNRLKEQKVLMTEIHHRLKNNLSTITSLIEMDLPKIEDELAIEALQNTCSRIKSITQVHSLLYQIGATGKIELGTYFKKLSQQINNTLAGKKEEIFINVDADPIVIGSERAMNCGLILNELILNAYKHAFTSMEGGRINVRVRENGEGIIKIVVSDNGKGIGDNFKVNRGESMGGWVVKALADRLDGTIEFENNGGTRCVLKFAR